MNKEDIEHKFTDYTVTGKDIKEYEQESVTEEYDTENFAKKKKKKKLTTKNGKNCENANPKKSHTYCSLIKRVFEELMQHKNDHQKLKITEPDVAREGSKKTAFVNFSRICRQINRDMNHFATYIATELGTTVSVDGNNRLIIKGRFYENQVKTILTKYINQFITCWICNANDTYIYKDQATRLQFLKCSVCNSQRPVASIKSGYSAIMRGDRNK